MGGGNIGFYKEKRKPINWYGHTAVWALSLYAGLIIAGMIATLLGITFIFGWIIGGVVVRLALYLFSKSAFYKRVRE